MAMVHPLLLRWLYHYINAPCKYRRFTSRVWLPSEGKHLILAMFHYIPIGPWYPLDINHSVPKRVPAARSTFNRSPLRWLWRIAPLWASRACPPQWPRCAALLGQEPTLAMTLAPWKIGISMGVSWNGGTPNGWFISCKNPKQKW